jgi:UDP-glucose:(heptosyl)LPS alpha-1,3-glucosyltransferase
MKVEAGMHIVQIVRNWGPVGGMESYVWHLSHALASPTIHITIVCEKAHTKTNSDHIRIVEIGQLRQKPRWVMYWRFANLVEKQIQALGLNPNSVIHSHERSITHDMTTFHAMPFATIKEKSWFKQVSIRVWAYLNMERRELGGLANQTVAIIPVSRTIAHSIEKYYPQVAQNIRQPISPGVIPLPQRLDKLVPQDGGTIGFFGTEWSRKGFALFMRIAEQLRILRPHLKVIVLGAKQDQITHLCKNYHGEISFLGWQPSSNIYQDLDLLIHPASSEAYGMVIAEAMACRVPVLISDQCGIAADITIHNGTVLPLNAPLEKWVQECNRWLNNRDQVSGFERPWAKVAQEYVAEYAKLLSLKKDR